MPMRLSSLNRCYQLIGQTNNFRIFFLEVANFIFEAKDFGFVEIVGLKEVIREFIIDF